MLFQLTLTTARRVLIPSLTSRSLLTRSISLSPAFSAPQKKVTVGTSAEAAKTKSSAKTKAKAGDKPKAKTKTKTKTKPESENKGIATKPKKKAKPKFARSEMKIPPRPMPNAWTYFLGQSLRGITCQPSERRELMKGVAEKWKAMSEEEKAPFKKLVEEMRVIRKKEFNEWLASVRPEVLRAINKKQKATGGFKIKSLQPRSRPLPVFLRFRSVYHLEHPEIVVSRDLTRAAAAAWRELPDDKKKVYHDAYHQEFEKIRMEQGGSKEQSV